MRTKTTKIETRLNDRFAKIVQEAEEIAWKKLGWLDGSRAKFRQWFLANCIKFAALNIIVNDAHDEVLSPGELDVEYDAKSSEQFKWSLPKRLNLN